MLLLLEGYEGAHKPDLMPSPGRGVEDGGRSRSFEGQFDRPGGVDGGGVVQFHRRILGFDKEPDFGAPEDDGFGAGSGEVIETGGDILHTLVRAIR